MSENEKIPPHAAGLDPTEAPVTEPAETVTPTEASDAENTPICDEKTAFSGAGAPEERHKNPNRKKLILLIATIVAVLLILGGVLLTSFLLQRRAPELDEIRGRAEALITASREVNEIFFGEGLPTYPRVYLPDYTLAKYKTTYREKEYNRTYYTFIDAEGAHMLKYQYCLAHGVDENSDGKPDHYEYPDLEKGGFLTVDAVNTYRYAERVTEAPAAYIYAGVAGKDSDLAEGTPYWWVAAVGYAEPFYYTAEDDFYYDYVTEDCPYQSIDEIKELASAVYSAEYLASLYESMFVGIVVSDRDTGTLFARYAEVEMDDGFLYLMKSNRTEPLNVKRVYDLSTMRMARGSNSKYVKLEIETYLEGEEQERLTVTVALTLENGTWYLDSPTY